MSWSTVAGDGTYLHPRLSFVTTIEATWLTPSGVSQLRDSAGISPDFALSSCPAFRAGHKPIVVRENHRRSSFASNYRQS